MKCTYRYTNSNGRGHFNQFSVLHKVRVRGTDSCWNNIVLPLPLLSTN